MRNLSDNERKSVSEQETMFATMAQDFKDLVRTIVYTNPKEAKYKIATAKTKLQKLLAMLDKIPDRTEHIETPAKDQKAFCVDTKYPGDKNNRLFAQALPANGVFILDGELVGGHNDLILTQPTIDAFQKIIDKYIKTRMSEMQKQANIANIAKAANTKGK